MKMDHILLGAGLGLLAFATTADAAIFVLGNPLTDRPSRDGANGSIFVLGTDEAGAGEVTDFGFFDNGASGRQITPILMQASGAGFDITGIGTTQTSNASGAQSAPFGLVSGSANIGLGSAIAFKDGSNGGNNPGTTEWTSGGTDVVGWFGAGQTSFTVGSSYGAPPILFREYSVEATVNNPGNLSEVVGHTVMNRGNNDGASGSIFVVDDPFTLGKQFTDWVFYDNDTAGREVTPLLLTEGGSGWEIVGVGATRTSDASGAQYHGFDLVSGSAVTGPGIYFGWKDGGNGTDNAGVIDSDFNRGNDVFWLGGGRTSFSVGDSYGVSGTFARAYSVQALAIPEPSKAVLLALGGLGLLLRRRRASQGATYEEAGTASSAASRSRIQS